MNHTTARVVRYTGAGIAGVATSCVLAAPAMATVPPYAPGSGEETVSTSPNDSPATQTSIASASDGIDWTAMAAALAGGAVLGGVIVVGASQVRRHQAHPA